MERLSSQNLLIGVKSDILGKHPEDVIKLNPKDRLVFYSDGITETVNSEGRMLGTSGLSDLVLRADNMEIFDVADFVLGELEKFRHGPKNDDEFLIVTQIK